jgi:aryl-alcohol dehydrogenase-like predicted oxidoreductase
LIVSPDLSRRSFLAGIAAGSPLLAGCRNQTAGPDEPASGDAPAATATAVRVPTRRLGKTDLRVPILEVGGTYRFNTRYVRQALDLGCFFFDTAASYVSGKSEQTLGESIAKLGVRKDVLVVTKGHPSHPGRLEAKIDESLARLKMDHVDIYYIHNLSRVEVLKDPTWRAEAERLKKAGKIRQFGFSAHNEHLVALLNGAAGAGWVDVIMFKYNFRSYGDEELNRAIDAAHKSDIGLIAMKTQGSAVSFADRVDPFKGAGYSKHQAVLKAVWKDERISSAISSMPSIAVLRENASAATRELTAIEAELLDEYAARTRDAYCHGGCGGCRRECESAMGRPVAIADPLRYLMYHDAYGRRSDAREKFARLPPRKVNWSESEIEQAASACPHRLQLKHLLGRAKAVLCENNRPV